MSSVFNILLILFFLLIGILSQAQKLDNSHYQLKYIIYEGDTCDLTDGLKLRITFSLPNWHRKHSRVCIRDKGERGIADIRTMGYNQQGTQVSFIWPMNQWERGHALYSYCFEYITKAFNNSYTIISVGNILELRSEKYTIVLSPWIR
jgi:hypothetical protein